MKVCSHPLTFLIMLFLAVATGGSAHAMGAAATVTVGTTPRAVAVNPVTNRIYAANRGDGTVTVIDGAGNGATGVTVGTTPVALGVNHRTNRIYVVNSGSNSVTVIDGATNGTTPLTVGTNPVAVAVNPVTNKIYVANKGSDSVTVIDGASNGIGTIPVGTQPAALAVNPLTNKVYVANSGGTVTVIDGLTNGTTQLTVGTTPVAVAVNPATNKIYVANSGSDSVTVIDGATNGTATVTVGTAPVALTVAPLVNKVYVANSGSSSVTEIDGSTNAAVTMPIGANPVAVMVDPANNRLYAANDGTSTITVLELTLSSTVAVTVGADPAALALNPVTGRVYVANSGGGTVSVLNGADSVATQVPVGGRPKSVAINEVTDRIYVANYDSSTITVIDGASGATSTVAIGGKPIALAVDPQANRIYVLKEYSDTVTVIDGATNAMTAVTLPAAPLYHWKLTGVRGRLVTVNPSTHMIYVVIDADFDYGSAYQLVAINGADNSASTVVTSLPGDAALAINPATNRVYVGSYSGAIYEYDGETYANTRSFSSSSGHLAALAVDTTANRLYFSTDFGWLRWINLTDASVSGLIASQVFLSGSGLAVIPHTGVVYGTTGNATLVVVDPGTGEKMAVPVGNGSGGMAVNTTTGRVYVANEFSNSVTVLNERPIGAKLLKVGNNPGEPVANPATGKIYVPNYGSASVTEIDGATNGTQSIPVGVGPVAVAVNPVTNRIYAAIYDSNSVTVIDGATRGTTTVATGSRPKGVTVNPFTNKVYVTNYAASSVTVIDGSTNGTTAVPVGTGPRGVAVNPVSNKVYVANNGNESVTVIDGLTNTTTTVPVGRFPGAVTINPDTNKIYVANEGGNSVTVIDGATNATTTVATGSYPIAVVVNRATNKIYVANNGGDSVTVIDGVTHATLTVPVGKLPRGIAVDQTTNTIYVTGSDSSLVYSKGYDQVAVIDGVSNSTSFIPVQGSQTALTVNPVTGKVYLADSGSGAVMVLDGRKSAASGLTAAITSLQGTTGETLSPTVSLNITGHHLPYGAGAESLQYQVDSWQGAWQQYDGSGTNRTPMLTPGEHVLYAMAADPLASTAINTGSQSSPLTGTIAPRWFLVYPTYVTLTITRAGSGSGRPAVSGCAVQWDGSSGTCTVPFGTTLTLSGAADSGSAFAGWSAATGSATCSGSGPCTITVNSTSAVTGSYTLNQYAVTGQAEPSAGGTVTCTGPVDHNTTAGCSVSANGGYRLVGLSGCGGAWDGSASYTTAAVTSGCTVTARFVPDTDRYVVTATPLSHGTLDNATPSPASVAPGDTASFTFNADSGYYVAAVTGCGVDYVAPPGQKPASYNATTGRITADCTLTARFHSIELSTPVFSDIGANQATLTLSAVMSGTGYFTLLQGADALCGSGDQIKAGLDGANAAAFRRGSLPLVADQPGTYTVRNLLQNSPYTVCFTVDDGTVVRQSPAAGMLTTATVAPSPPVWSLMTGFDRNAGSQSLAFAPDGTPFLAISDKNNGYRATVLTYDGSGWTPVGSPLITSGGAYNPVLTFSPTGTLLLGFADGVNGNRATLMKFDGSAWVAVGNADSAPMTGTPSLAFDSAGVLYVAEMDIPGSYKITVRKFDGNSWTTVGSAGFTPETYTSALSVAPDGTPYLVYTDRSSYKAAVMGYDGSAWQAVGGDISAGYVFLSMIAIAPDGTPYVAFQDYDHGQKATVVKLDGSNWAPVGSVAFSQSGAGNLSLAFAPDGAPWLAYSDSSTGGGVTVKRFDGSNWSTIAGSVNNGSTQSVSLLFAPDGEPYVSYLLSYGINSTVPLVSRLTAAPVTGQATAINSSSATLHGTATGFATTVSFEYGFTTAYGNTVTAAQSPLNTVAISPVSADATGLLCGATYHYRIKTVGIEGTRTGADGTFTTTFCSSHSVLYMGNGADSGSVPVDNASYPSWSTVTVAGNSGNLARTGYVLSGWNTRAEGSSAAYAASGTDSFIMGSDSSTITLYAQWTGSVNYDANGATGGTTPADPAPHRPGATITVAGNSGSLTRNGYVFAGWNTKADGTGVNYFPGGTFPFAGTVTLYAYWLGPPNATSATGVTATSFTATWEAVPGALGYLLDVATDSAFTAFVPGFRDFYTSSTGTQVFSLAPGTKYFYRLRAYHISASAYSNVMEVTTSAAPVAGILADPIVAGRVFAAVDGIGVYRSTDSGANWTVLPLYTGAARVKALILPPPARTTLYAALYGLGVFYSSNGGDSWNFCNGNLGNTNILTLAADGNGRLYAGTEGGIYTSTDCTTWSAINSGLTLDAGKPPVALVIDPTLPNTIYAGFDGGGVYKSTNGGTNWSAANNNLDLRVKALARSATGALFAGTYGGGVFQSGDSGGTWNACPALPDQNVLSLVTDGSGRLYAGTGNGMFVSTDGCSSWTAINGGLP